MKVSELIGAELDYWVVRANGLTPYREEGHTLYWLVKLPEKPCMIIGMKPKPPNPEMRYSPSVNWSQGGPIIERERIQSRFVQSGYFVGDKFKDKWLCSYPGGVSEIGDTQLIAAMRAYVASKFGETVDDRQAHHV